MPNRQDEAERTTCDCEGVQMTPAQVNEVIETNLVHLKPAFEGVYCEMVRLKDELANGKFSVAKLMKRAKKKVDDILI